MLKFRIFIFCYLNAQILSIFKHQKSFIIIFILFIEIKKKTKKIKIICQCDLKVEQIFFVNSRKC